MEKSHIESLPDIESVEKVKIKSRIIKYATILSTTFGMLIIESIDTKDSSQLFEFYFHGLSETARVFFCPYPIFSPRPNNPEELAHTIKKWKKEHDWTMLKLTKDMQIIGVCLLKRYSTDRPTSGLAVHEGFQNKGLGMLLQTIINEQCRLLGIKKLVITLAPNNKASFRTHQKAGFKKTNRLVPHFTYIRGVKTIDRQDIEMVKKFD